MIFFFIIICLLLCKIYLEVEKPENAFVPGKFRQGEKPSDFAGTWADDERTVENIRKKAWIRYEGTF